MKSPAFAASFSEWAAAPELQLAPEARRAARFSLVDTLACIQAGSNMPQSSAATAALTAIGDTGRAVPFGGGPALSLTGASLVNGTRAHALDFDDYELSGSSHASGSILGALLSLAAAEKLTVGSVCEAWAVGYEALLVLGAALGYGHYAKGWHTSLTLGPIAAAAASARVLGLDAARTAHALTLASSSSAGSLRQTGFDAKALHGGLAAQAGLQAAFLARAGATANTGAWELTSGFAGLYGTPDSPGFDAALAGMAWGDGTVRFPVVRKRWPSCAYTQRPIDAATKAASQICEGESIESVHYRMPRPFHTVAHYDMPANDAQARFSVPYCLAAGLERGRVTAADFLPAAWSRTTRRDLVSKVDLELYDLPAGHSGDIGPTAPEKLTVRLSSGRTLQITSLAVPGGVELPMTEPQLLEKAADCGLPEEHVRELLGAAPDVPLHSTALFSAPARSRSHALEASRG